jgi:hypothetical protein
MNSGMSVVTLKAHYDGKHICLDEPIDLPANAQLMVTVWPAPDESLEEERAAWFAFAQQSFARAYGDDEPDYSHCVGKAPPSE